MNRLNLLLAGALASFAPAGIAATFIANSPLDFPDDAPGDGVCRTAALPAGLCTLRAAVMEANALAGLDTVRLLPGMVYTLTRSGADDTAVNGDLDVLQPLIVECVGCAQAGTRARIDANGLDRAFDFHSGNSSLIGFDVTGGHVAGVAATGGALRVLGGTQFALDMRLYGNAAPEGAALWVAPGAAMFMTRNELRDNQINTVNPNLIVGTVRNNGLLVVEASAIYDNGWSSGRSNAISTTDAHTTIHNTTISNNNGFGLRVQGGQLDIRNVTIAGNASTGVTRFGANAVQIVLRNSILAFNESGNCSSISGPGVSTDGYNLSSDGSCDNIGDTTNLSFADPLLTPLRRRFGQAHTPVHWPRVDSPALSAAAPQAAGDLACESDDQNDTPRPQGFNGTVRCDIGAAEVPDDAIFFDSFETHVLL